jgi:hypothetical protein
MKLNEHTRRLLLLPSVRIARSKLFFISLFFSTHGITTLKLASQLINRTDLASPKLYGLKLPKITRYANT